jgi:hypothetical protein
MKAQNNNNIIPMKERIKIIRASIINNINFPENKLYLWYGHYPARCSGMVYFLLSVSIAKQILMNIEQQTPYCHTCPSQSRSEYQPLKETYSQKRAF